MSTMQMLSPGQQKAQENSFAKKYCYPPSFFYGHAGPGQCPTHLDTHQTNESRFPDKAVLHELFLWDSYSFVIVRNDQFKE